MNLVTENNNTSLSQMYTVPDLASVSQMSHGGSQVPNRSKKRSSLGMVAGGAEGNHENQSRCTIDEMSSLVMVNPSTYSNQNQMRKSIKKRK